MALPVSLDLVQHIAHQGHCVIETEALSVAVGSLERLLPKLRPQLPFDVRDPLFILTSDPQILPEGMPHFRQRYQGVMPSSSRAFPPDHGNTVVRVAPPPAARLTGRYHIVQ